MLRFRYSFVSDVVALRREHARATAALAVVVSAAASACITLSPDGARVAVVRAALPRPREEAPSPPDGCRLIASHPQISMTEQEIDGQKHPFAQEQNEAASHGANVLLVRTRQVIGGRDLECPAALPISDCPPSSGAWFDVRVESYACSAEAIRALQPRAKPSPKPES